MSDDADPPTDVPIHDGVYNATKELTDDADTDTTRRRVCQAASVLGITSLAGCSMLSGDDSTPSDDAQPVKNETEESVPSAADIDALIDEHVAQIEGKSYTVDVELQGPGTDTTIKKQINYKRSASGEPFVSLREVSTIDDGVESLTHYFGPDLHGVEIGFADGSRNAAALDVASEVLTITGASIFQEYLVGAAVAEPTETSDGLEKYPVRAHSRYEFDTGFVTVGPDDVIRQFRLEWTDSNGIERWIEANSYDVGSTAIEKPDF